MRYQPEYRDDERKPLRPLNLLRFYVWEICYAFWRHDCDRQGGATRYQVDNSTDGVRWLPGWGRWPPNFKRLQLSHGCKRFYYFAIL